MARGHPAFFSFRGEAGWWGDRNVSVADFAGQEVAFHFTAKPTDGRDKPSMALGGFDRVAMFDLGQGSDASGK